MALGISLNFEEIKVTAAEATAGISQTTDCRIVTIDAGQTISLTTPVDLVALFGDAVSNIPEDTENDLAFRSTATLQLLPPDASACTIDESIAELVKEHKHVFRVRPYDVGDAPDSTNHFATAMTAYPAVPAKFPTVFDPATDPGPPPGPQGPAHARPRPFHLGKGVEFEVDADLPPAPRNINPATDTPNRDDFDDGARPDAWALKHCQVATVQVQVFISPQAAAWFAAKPERKGYLNGWLDGNRDGDWADGGKCQDASGAEKVTLEHIIIDYPVDVAALGAGLHTISVTTGNVPWPPDQAQKHAWVRLTLSEQPSNKALTTEGIAHGDGRGYAKPFRTGETEDYLLRPKGSAGRQAGPDDRDVRRE